MKQDSSLKKYAILTVTMASFLTPFMGSAINLAIPSIGREFNSGAVYLSWVVSSYLLATAAFLLPFGRLADIVGRKKIFTYGIVLFSVFSMLCGLAWSIQALIVFRIFQGIGSAMIFGTGMAILTSVFPPHERGKVLGINVATVYTGLSMGPVLGGVMNQHLGWESIFYLNAALGLVILLLAAIKLKGEWAGAAGERFDATGAVLCMVGLVAFIYGFSSIATSVWSRYILAVGVLVILVFIRHEARVEQPILNMRLFSKNITFAFSNLAALINYSATFAVGFLMSLQLQVVMGFNSQTAGLILLSQPILMALLSPFAGALSDRVQPRLIASLGMSLNAVGLFIFGFINMNTPTWFIMINLAILGTGFALFSSPNSNAIMGSVEKRYYGVASSTMGTMRLVGQAISLAIATLMIDLYLGSAQLSAENANLILKSVSTSFFVFSAACLGGVFASLARGSVKAVEKPGV